MIGNLSAAIFTPGAVLGDYESIATVTVGSGGQASIVFNSIPATYQHLQLRGIARSTASITDGTFRVSFNSDTTAGNYPQHFLYGDGSSAASGYSPNDANIGFGRLTGASSTAGRFGVAVADILDYRDTNKYKTLRSLNGQDQNGSGIILFGSGFWKSTAAITSMTITPSSGNFAEYTHIALYGIKG